MFLYKYVWIDHDGTFDNAWYLGRFCFHFESRLSAGVNLINVPRAHFLYECHFGSFFYVHVIREKLPKQFLYQKFVRITLMKLTAGGINNLRADLQKTSWLSKKMKLKLKCKLKLNCHILLWSIIHCNRLHFDSIFLQFLWNSNDWIPKTNNNCKLIAQSAQQLQVFFLGCYPNYPPFFTSSQSHKLQDWE